MSSGSFWPVDESSIFGIGMALDHESTMRKQADANVARNHERSLKTNVDA